MNKFQITPHLKLNGYEFQREIGRGQFAVVWEALHIFTNNQVAIKCIATNPEIIDHQEITIIKEIYFNQKIFHPYICQYFDFFVGNSFFFLVFEHCNENLVTFSNKRGFLDEKTAHKIFCELIYAVESLHNDYSIIHRDLKVENILIDSNKNARISDFGLSISIEPRSLQNSKHSMNQQVGSIYYMSPEMAKNEEYDKSIDIWSLGIILYAITNGKLPFDGNSVDSVRQKILFTQPQFQSHFSSFSPNLKTLIIRMLDKNKKSRITIEEIKMNPWFLDRKYKKIEDLKYISFNLTQSQIDCQIIQKILKMNSNESNSIEKSIQDEMSHFNQIRNKSFHLNEPPKLSKEKLDDNFIHIEQNNNIEINKTDLNNKVEFDNNNEKNKNDSNIIYDENINNDETENNISVNDKNIKTNNLNISNCENLDKSNECKYEVYGIKIRSKEFVSYLIQMRENLKLQMKIEEKDIINNKPSILTSQRNGKRQMSQPSKVMPPLSQSMKPSVKKPIVPIKKQTPTNKSKKQPFSLSMKSHEIKKKKP